MVNFLAVARSWVFTGLGGGRSRRRKDRSGGKEQVERGALHGGVGYLQVGCQDVKTVGNEVPGAGVLSEQVSGVLSRRWPAEK